MEYEEWGLNEPKTGNQEKKQLIIFAVIAFGITYLLGILMWYGYSQMSDLSAFPNAQMLYPAAGVMMAYLCTRGRDKEMPKSFFCFFIVVTVVLIGIAIASVIAPDQIIVIAGNPLSLWMIIPQYVLIVGSIVAWIFYLAAGKERRRSYGLSWRHWKTSVGCIALFIGLYLLRTLLSYAMSGEIGSFMEILKSPMTWMSFGVLPINFFLVFIAFFGEEYGWRYYLQPILQKHFGCRKGVIILGIIWGLWHLPIDFFYYTGPEMGPQAVVSQQITCITIGIFFAYAYMKTQNIWVPVILHYLNNNLVPIIVGNYAADVLENQQITWGQLPAALLINGLFFGIFILSKEFKKK